MAATNFTPISLYYSTTASAAPTAGNLVAGELAINTADGKLFYKDSAGVVQVIGTKGGVGSSTTTQVLYNSSGSLAGSSNFVFDGTNVGIGGASGGARFQITGTTNASSRVDFVNNTSSVTASLGSANDGTAILKTVSSHPLVFGTVDTEAMRISTAQKVTVTNDASISGLTVGKGGGALGTNTALGLNALLNNSTGQGLVGVGRGALQANTSGQSNIAVGGTYNTDPSLFRNTTGSFNTAVGEGSLSNNTTASNNTAVGYQAGYSNTTGTYSTLIGTQAGYSQTTGYGTHLGWQAGYSATTGQFNTFLGIQSGYYVTTGAKNTILGCYTGNQGGLDIRTASNYIVLSDGDGNPRGIFDGSGSFSVGTTDFGGANTGGFQSYYGAGASRLYIGHVTGTANGTQYIVFNYNGTSQIGSITQSGTTAVLYNVTSDYRLKNDVAPIANALATVEALNPVSFTWIDGRKDDGFLAHEIQAVIPNCVTGEKDAVNEDGTPKYQQMDSSGVIPFLVKAIQELKAEVDSLKQQINGA